MSCSIIFQSDRDGDLGLFQQRADGSTPATRNFDVMPDGRLLVILPVSATTTNGPRTTTQGI